jgi:hypothetical protein
MKTLQNTSKRYSTSYVATVNHHSDEGKALVAAYKALVKAEDKLNSTSRRVVLQGRMGKNNPSAHLYSVNAKEIRSWGAHTHQAIKLVDAMTADVYIYNR